ncbi:unnamed protein product, partial [Parnassius apollo]
YSLEGHQFAVFAFRLSSDKRYVVSISSRVISWDLSTSDLARDLCPQLEGIMQNLEISPDNKWAAASTNNSLSELYKTGDGTFCPKTTSVDEKVVALLSPQFKPLSNYFDSSAPYYTIDIVETQQQNDTHDSSQEVLGAKEDSVHQLQQLKGSKRRISPLLVSDITLKKKICLNETKKEKYK